MGVWGPGNFENERCSFHLTELCEPILEEVSRAIAEIELLDQALPDDRIPANLEIIACLVENLGRHQFGGLYDFLYPCELPHADELFDWKHKFLNKWDECIEHVEPAHDHQEERRAVIVNTFDRIIRAVLAQSEDGVYPEVSQRIVDG